MIRIFDRVWFEPVRPAAPLRSITLRQALEHTDAVVYICKLPSWHFTSRAGLVQQPATLTHKIGMVDRMLSDAMRSFSSVNSTEPLGGPAVSRDDRAQASGVRVVHCGHPRMIAIE